MVQEPHSEREHHNVIKTKNPLMFLPHTPTR